MFNRILALAIACYFSTLAVAQPLTGNNPVYKIRHDNHGIEVAPISFSPATLKSNTSWNGKWIWVNDAVYPSNQQTKTAWSSHEASPDLQYRALFRKQFVFSGAKQVFMFLSADVAYRVYLNDSLVSQGPVNVSSDYGDDTAPQYWFYSSLDITRFIKPGKNQLAIEVYSWAFEISQATRRRGGLICDIKTTEGKLLAASDSSWRSIVDTSYRYVNGGLVYDAQKMASDWTSARYNDQHWHRSSITAIKSTDDLVLSQIPVPVKYSLAPDNIQSDQLTNELQGTSFSRHKDIVFDYGRNMAAFIRFSAEASAGDTIDILPKEKLENTPNRSFRFICKEGHNDFETPYLSAYRYLVVRTKNKPGTKINSVNALYSSYPLSYIGSFSCSNSFYNKLWEIVRWTTQMCMNDMFFDSPMHQEPIACTGDYFIQSMNNYYAFGDPWLTRQNLVQTARMLEKNEYKMFHTSYSLIWVQMLRQYYQYTGDSSVVRELYPHVVKLLHRFQTYLDKDYLVSNAPDYMFMDWISINGFNAHHPPAVIGMGYMTTLYYKALNELSALGDIIGRREDGLQQLTGPIREGVNVRLWDEDKNLYRDGFAFITATKPNSWLPADTNITTYTPHMNSMAVLYGVAPAERGKALMKYVIDQNSYELQPYFMWYVLSALQSVGSIDEGLDLINRWRNGIDTTTFTLKENWRDKTEFGYGGDYSHAWGGAAMYFLSRNTLGIYPEEAGYKTIGIQPYTGDRLEWAEGKVPVGKGSVIDVKWRKQKDGKLKFNYIIPVGRRATLHVPQEWSARNILLNGREVGKQDVIRLVGGKHEILIK